MFHMAWFLPNGVANYNWNDDFGGTAGTDWMQPELYQELALALERASFDFMMFEDSSVVFDVYEGSMRFQLARAGAAPKQDPMPYLPVIARATSKIGLIATLSTSFYPPFLAARLGATLDHLTKGRIGFNLVTASGDAAAQNYGLERHLAHADRYEMAEEWIDVAKKLWDSWEPDAVVLDRENNVYADHEKVHHIDHQGKYFSSRGPLNTIPGPQRHPVICQAGGSPAGRQLAAKVADTIVSVARGVEGMKAFRDDISAQMIAEGRDPSDCKVLFLISPIIGRTTEEAEAKRDAARAAQVADVEAALWAFSGMSGIDFSQFELDEPIPDHVRDSNGHTSLVAEWFAEPRKTVRELAASYRTLESVELVGTADDVARQMGEVMDAVGGDGFLVAKPVTREAIVDIADGLAPALKRRGLIRDGYEFDTFRENLLAF